MRVPLDWLREYCDPDLDTAAIEERLTMTGTKVETILRDEASGSDVLELEITPNRPDCLGVYGVARELHAATGAPLADEPWSEDPGSAGSVAGARVLVECPDLCRRFTARVFEDVTVGPSPPWLAARLSAAGQRPINNVVDITNYAMLLTGQPLHAFDLDRVAGATLTVRRARDGERVVTLDGETRTLDGEMVVIEDEQGPTSIAGVMGGARSEVGEGSTRVLMEVANWSGPSIHRTSWALGLRSEASARFEKDLAPEQCLHAQALASRLMVEMCKAKVLPGTIDVGAAASGEAGEQPASTTIRLRERRVEAILGMPVPRARQAEILRALGFGVSEAGDGLDVSVPAVRRDDVTRETDLIEEVARIHGLERLPASLPARRGAYGRLSARQRMRRRAVDTLVGRGLYEIMGWTFTAPSLAERLRLPEDDPRRNAPVLENPLSEEHSLLRTTLLGSLLDVASHNGARDMSDVRLFEVGTVFAVDGDTATPSGAPSRPAEDGGAAALRETGVRERLSLGVLLSGRLAPPTWGSPDPPRADLFAVKGVLEALGEALRVELDCLPASQPFLHPGRAASIHCGERRIGWLGELHPLVASEWRLDGAAAMELDLAALSSEAVATREYRDVISFPALRQDIAVVLGADVPAADVLSAVHYAASGLLDDVRVFDVYTGPQLGEGKRSLALSLSFRVHDRTLTDEDVMPVRERIVAALGELGGELRG